MAVTAESLYEAAALGVSLLRKDYWGEALAPGTQLEVRVCAAGDDLLLVCRAAPALVRRCCRQSGGDAQEAEAERIAVSRSLTVTEFLVHTASVAESARSCGEPAVFDVSPSDVECRVIAPRQSRTAHCRSIRSPAVGDVLASVR